MKHQLAICLLFCFLLASSAFGQTTTTLPISKSNINFFGDFPTGDSTTEAYNNKLQPILHKRWNLDTMGNWVLNLRIADYTYDAEGRLLYALTQVGDDVSGWVNSRRNTYTFDATGNELSGIEEKWNGTNWVLQTARYQVYDANGNVLSRTSGNNRVLFVYDVQGLLETKTYQEFFNGNWLDQTRLQYAYSPNNTTETTYNWIDNAWKESSRSTDTFDANGNLIQNLYEQWNGTSWENSILSLSGYDADGFLVQDLRQDWNGASWENNFLASYTYDVENNLTYWVSSNWVGNTWVSSIRQFNGYDAESNWVSGQLDLWDGTTWSLLQYGRFHYAEFVSAHTPAFAAFEVFPNPASTAVTLKSEGLSHMMIFDQQGRLVHTKNLQGQAQEIIQIGNLPEGNYFLQVLGSDGRMGAKPLQIRR